MRPSLARALPMRRHRTNRRVACKLRVSPSSARLRRGVTRSETRRFTATGNDIRHHAKRYGGHFKILAVPDQN